VDPRCHGKKGTTKDPDKLELKDRRDSKLNGDWDGKYRRYFPGP